jgi:hypothetical protein
LSLDINVNFINLSEDVLEGIETSMVSSGSDNVRDNRVLALGRKADVSGLSQTAAGGVKFLEDLKAIGSACSLDNEGRLSVVGSVEAFFSHEGSNSHGSVFKVNSTLDVLLDVSEVSAVDSSLKKIVIRI